ARTPDGEKTGIDHLVELGITHVHLLPSFDFFSLDESMVPNPNFNWGYDPLNYNVPEGTYATDPFDPATRIREFKEMVMALHAAGIGVVMDVVYNHTGPTADHWFNLVAPHFYHRMTPAGDFSNGSGCGNEIADEKAMVRKYIVDSVKYWAQEYNVSGFRFDLMGLHHVDTMNAVREALDAIDSRIIVYGEGWTGGASTLPAGQAALKKNACKVSERVAFFSDDIRDGIKGSVFNADEPGWVSGDFTKRNEVMFGVVAAVPHGDISQAGLSNGEDFWATAPTQHITYVSAHDNLTLYDKLKASAPGATEADLLAMNRMAAAIVLTSQGIPFLHAAEDMARTKFGDENSYKSPDSINQIRWDTKAKYRELFDYYRGLIALRKATPAFRLRTAAEVARDIKFMDAAPHVIAYTVTHGGQTLLVAFNAGREAYTLAAPIHGAWEMLVDGVRAGTTPLAQVNDGALTLSPRASYVFKLV
ncbi:MAG: type I pullulanase, partial [Defluviitaleaceae bacterium]|nr:type I pullulanase [Defluviitaleaceae bacterium]